MDPIVSPPVSAELAAIRAARAAVVTRTATATAARAARAEDPAVQLAEEKLALAREKLAADLAEHELLADAVYLEACLAQGEDRIGRIATRYGSIVIRAQSQVEIDANEARAEAHRRAAKQAKTPAEVQLAEKNALSVLEMGFEAAVLTDKGHFQRVIAGSPAIWATLWRARNTLIDASVLAEGKAGAH